MMTADARIKVIDDIKALDELQPSFLQRLHFSTATLLVDNSKHVSLSFLSFKTHPLLISVFPSEPVLYLNFAHEFSLKFQGQTFNMNFVATVVRSRIS